MNNTEQIRNVKMSAAEQSIYLLFGTDPNTNDELADESTAYQECEFENHEQQAFEENHLNDDNLTRFAQLKLQAKAAGDKIEYAKLVEHEKLFKAEKAASERQAKLEAREKERKEKEALRLQELAEVEAEKTKVKQTKEAERKAQLALKAHLAKLAKDEPTPELVYALTTGAMPNLASDTRDENVSLYEWVGSHWEKLTKHEGKKRAFDWLAAKFPNMAGNKLANNAYESALYTVQQLPEKPKQTIIPLKNIWIEVSDKGFLRLVTPDKTHGITYNVAASLKFKPGSRFYTPKPVPADSMFGKFINSSLPEEDVRHLVQEYCGYTLLNDNKYHVAQVWEGGGSNGKSVLLAIMAKLHEKTAAVDLDHLDGFNLAALRDASIAISAETPKGQLNENMLKACIAGDPVSMCFKYEMPFTYRPTAKWIMSCNRFPRIQDDTNAVFRRLQYIRWGVIFSGKDIIHDLEKQIVEKELDIVIDWCLAGIQRLEARQSFKPPASVEARIEEEKVASNSVLAYVNESEIETSPSNFHTSKNGFYQSYEKWAQESGATSYGGGEFWKRMKNIFPDLKETQKTVEGKRARYVNIQPKIDVSITPENLDEVFE